MSSDQGPRLRGCERPRMRPSRRRGAADYVITLVEVNV
jgi:hypothetical protein